MNEQKAFTHLAAMLTRYRLPTSTGARRHATANEFMYMQSVPSSRGVCHKFKHADSRNYLYAIEQSGKWHIHIPTGAPFHQGTFDLLG